MDLILKPIKISTSKPARQTYLHTLLFTAASSILLGFATFAYVLFYCQYVPQIGIERVIHLQYGDGPHPYGVTAVDSLISQQPYDISLLIHVPRSPPNLARGNFMLSLALLSPTYKHVLPVPRNLPVEPKSHPAPLTDGEVIFSTRRTAILTYTSHLISLTSRMFALPLYSLGLRSESEILLIPMGEGATFSKGWKNVPGSVLLEIEAGQDIQIYDVRILFKARFGGLRWLMYNHRVTSFVIFTGLFWLSEVIFAVLAWIGLGSLFAFKNAALERRMDDDTDGKVINKESATDDEPDLSDTPRTFPTYGRQPPLRYTPQVKEEVISDECVIDEAPLKVEADDEDEESAHLGTRTSDGVDSGIGTSYSESGNRITAKRRSIGRK